MTAGWSVPAPAVMWRTCALCGARSDDLRDVHPAMWPTRRGPWASGSRCLDRIGCRDRCEAKGDAWPVDDGTPATAPATDATPESPRAGPTDAPDGQTRDDPDDWSFDR